MGLMEIEIEDQEAPGLEVGISGGRGVEVEVVGMPVEVVDILVVVMEGVAMQEAMEVQRATTVIVVGSVHGIELLVAKEEQTIFYFFWDLGF